MNDAVPGDDWFTESAALAMSMGLMASAGMAVMATQSLTFWGAAIDGFEKAKRPANRLSGRSSSPSGGAGPRRTVSRNSKSRQRSWYRRPVESPALGIVKFWEDMLPAETVAFWARITTPALAPCLDMMGSNARFSDISASTNWLLQPSHNGWTKSPVQEMSDAWSWLSDPVIRTRR